MSDQEPAGLLITSTPGDAGGTRLTLRGELDAATAGDLLDAVAAAGPGEVALDLADVTFVDSSGLAAIIEASLVLRDRGEALVVEERSVVVSRVLELSGVETHLGLGRT